MNGTGARDGLSETGGASLRKCSPCADDGLDPKMPGVGNLRADEQINISQRG